MALTKKEVILLKEQGLEADVRNKLGGAKNIPTLFKQYTTEENPIQKEKIFQLLNKEIKKLEKSVNQICDSFIYFEIKEKKI